MDDRSESRWAIVEDGSVIWFPSDDPGAKGCEYMSGIVVEDNGDKVFIESGDGRVHNVSKSQIAAYRKNG